MKTEALILKNPVLVGTSTDPLEIYDLYYKIPYLPAYAVVSHYIKLISRADNAASSVTTYTLKADELIVKAQRVLNLDDRPVVELTVQHVGIADHALLFPFIENESRRLRVGELAFEAEKNFESGAWASFVIMVGGVIEGILGSYYGDKSSFEELIKTAVDCDLISQREFKSLDEVREARHLLFADKHQTPFVDRKKAMAIYSTYYQIIRREWS